MTIFIFSVSQLVCLYGNPADVSLQSMHSPYLLFIHSTVSAYVRKYFNVKHRISAELYAQF